MTSVGRRLKSNGWFKAGGACRPAFATICSLATAALLGLAVQVSGQPFDGCPSNAIQALFTDFARSGKMPPEMGRWLHEPEAQKIVPWKAFENVHYVGACWVSSWAIRTDDGVVLIDTLHEPHVDRLVANLGEAAIGLDEIKYVLMTHGHFDHVGGAFKLKTMLPNARFVMSEAGWNEALQSARQSEGTPLAWQMIEPDMVVKDGDAVELGGNTFRVIETPGHTWGTVSYTYQVRDGERAFRAVTIGGLGLNAVDGSKQVEAYIDSVDRLRRLVEREDDPVTVHLTTHSFSNGLMEDRTRVEARKAGEPHALVNPEGLLVQLALLRSRAENRLEIELKAGR